MTETPMEALVRQANAKMAEAAAMLPWRDPVACVQWVRLDQVQANDWNPNSVAHIEMKLLHTSIASDGYTQPVVCIWDPEAGPDRAGRYVIVDGFHRWTVMRLYPDILAATNGYLPVVVIDKPVADRMASTVRHNRARGKHSVKGMSNLVFAMLQQGESDEEICDKIGLEPEELARLKHVTGYSKLYADHEFSKVTLTKSQIEARQAYARSHPGERIPEEL